MDRNDSSRDHQSEHSLFKPFYFIGRQCDSGASGPGQRLTCGSWGSWKEFNKVGKTNPTLFCFHRLCVWMVSDAVVIIVQSSPVLTSLSSELKLTENQQLCSCVWSNMHVLCRSEAVVPMLTFVQKRGNATFYEWRTGKTPTVVDRPVVEEAPADAITEDTVGMTVRRNQNARKLFFT